MPVLYVRVPDERIGPIIGPAGRTKRLIQDRTQTRISIDTTDGEVEISSDDAGDPIGAMKARDMVLAIGRGFSPERALRLLRDDTYLGVIDIKRVTGHRDKAGIWRIRSRLIGVRGRARTRIEELSGASVSIFGTTVALIGQEKQLENATRAVELLLRGSEHSTVFHLLARMKRDQAVEEALQPADAVEELPDPE
ncbi:MAG: KH domain-containing protein [Thermoplasmata archaeon]|nr:KH domain-containing protein [Thermoplasmata archaeon]